MPGARWIRNEETALYIIDCYVGVHNGRRLFIWIEGENYVEGNTDAFLRHLMEKFELLLSIHAASNIHEFLREMGDYAKAQDATPRARKPGHPKKFKQPEPDSWIIGPAPSSNDLDEED